MQSLGNCEEIYELSLQAKEGIEVEFPKLNILENLNIEAKNISQTTLESLGNIENLQLLTLNIKEDINGQLPEMKYLQELTLSSGIDEKFYKGKIPENCQIKICDDMIDF